MKRTQEKLIKKDLNKKYVFLAGPRQSGKTTLARQLLSTNQIQYLNYDLAEDRQIIIKGEWSRDKHVIILDEVHKLPKWKTFIKGYYDKEGLPPSLLITGSARLNIYKKGNDSMLGRYYSHRLLPFSVKEIGGNPQSTLEKILKFGNFPEPHLSASELESKRWKQQYLDSVIKEDVADLSHIKLTTKLTLLVDLLRQRVGSTISYSSLAQDLEVASSTVKDWIEILEELYLIFRVSPYHKNIARSLLKEPKIYFFDATMAFDPDAHLENFIAVSLLKHLWFLEDTQGITAKLHYLKVKDGSEVDFLTVQDKKPVSAIEVKTKSDSLHKGLLHFKKFLPETEFYQLVKEHRQDRDVEKIKIRSAADYLSELAI